MIPSLFVLLEKLPLNANGKIDRKLLPAPQFASLTNIDQTDGIPLTSLEEHLQRIFGEAFHNESPNVNMTFGQLGGTSLDVIRALVLIRQEICTKVDVRLLFSNPSIRQLARIIEPQLVTLWSTNNSYWLKHLLGTPFYNSYLRLCGAKIECHTHIYTTLIDAPWLLEAGESSFIGEEVVLSSLSYQDQTYRLHRIRIGSYCSINTHSVLYEDVIIEDHVYVKPMSAITGVITTSKGKTFIKDRSLSLIHTVYQSTCLLCLLFIHGIILLLVYGVHSYCSTLLLPLPISLALAWLIWTLTSFCIALALLKFIVGRAKSGYYSINSYDYLHKLWLRQLIITSFHQALDFLPSYDAISSYILRWLGAHIEGNVKFAEFQQILRFPSNLLNIEGNVTTFGGANLASFKMTKQGLCFLDEIHLGSNANLGNWCTIMPATRLPPKVIVGSLTLITQKTFSAEGNCVLLGIPARDMPFVMPDDTSIFLVFLFRILGAQIASDVILPDIRCLTDPHLVNIGDHVRLNRNAVVQAHTFEQRILKLAPITIDDSTVLMSNTLILPGATLQGQNRILPWTLVMKNDQLPPNTNWSGVPAKQVI
ncbi:unnamed protein product [Rotaria sordida]|nr:unnamed protein product [Rotaria sordida]